MKLSYFVSIASKSIWKALLMMVLIFASTQGLLSGSVEGIEDEKALRVFIPSLKDPCRHILLEELDSIILNRPITSKPRARV